MEEALSRLLRQYLLPHEFMCKNKGINNKPNTSLEVFVFEEL